MQTGKIQLNKQQERFLRLILKLYKIRYDIRGKLSYTAEETKIIEHLQGLYHADNRIKRILNDGEYGTDLSGYEARLTGNSDQKILNVIAREYKLNKTMYDTIYEQRKNQF